VVSGHAIADGFLYFPKPNGSAERYAQLEVGMDKETVKLIRLMAEEHSSLATYAFKNLASGREEVMHAVPNLSSMPVFEWTNCKAPDCAMLTMHEAERTKVREAERNVGPDAKSPIWTLNHPGVARSTGKRKRDDDSNDQNKATPSLST
jgi:hypothetical protein